MSSVSIRISWCGLPLKQTLKERYGYKQFMCEEAEKEKRVGKEPIKYVLVNRSPVGPL